MHTCYLARFLSLFFLFLSHSKVSTVSGYYWKVEDSIANNRIAYCPNLANENFGDHLNIVKIIGT